MTLEKLTIKYEKGQKDRFTGQVKVLFNPSQISTSKTISWTVEEPAARAKAEEPQEPDVVVEEPETMTISLFFDTYGDDPEGGLLFSARPTSVLKYTEEVAALARSDPELHRPPVCELRWGTNLLFKGVVQSMSRQLLLFLEDGTPVRATMECTFRQLYATRSEFHSADVVKRYTVLPGDTLTRIAAELYGDQAQWRRIAEENGIDDPRRLTPGRVLAIPKIR